MSYVPPDRDDELNAADAFLEALDEMQEIFRELEEDEHEAKRKRSLVDAYDYAMSIL